MSDARSLLVNDLATGSFSVYIDDATFKSDMLPTITFVRRMLGEPVTQVELDDYQIATAYEESALEYSAWVNNGQVKNWLSNLMGESTASDFQGKLPQNTIDFAKRMSSMWGMETSTPVGGSFKIRTARFSTAAHTQSYDIVSLMKEGKIVDSEDGGIPPATSDHSSALASGSFEFKEVWHHQPSYVNRYVDIASPYYNLASEFNFESYSPEISETSYIILPIWEQVLRTQEYEMHGRVRRSNYSYYFQNRTLYINPVPQNSFKIYFQYLPTPNVLSGSFAGDRPEGGGDFVSDISNASFKVIPYKNINTMGRRWIRRYTLALSKELLGIVRSKFASLPIPNAEIQLNGDALKQEGREEQQQLIEELKELLDATSFGAMMEGDNALHSAINDQLKRAPSPIFIG